MDYLSSIFTWRAFVNKFMVFCFWFSVKVSYDTFLLLYGCFEKL